MEKYGFLNERNDLALPLKAKKRPYTVESFLFPNHKAY
ncbi:hypothetical protein M23134_02979 [Microscilla marina ATCC 23134]|uniref:Uncharacterized protein n=1 Tax=Microscilla marina ATCC 23134 TaxID=313606 RepID=A1ZSI0_MICM2|nr:hypothetical protein M23134_02979 [Microscilla marina ATCC 23134]